METWLNYKQFILRKNAFAHQGKYWNTMKTWMMEGTIIHSILCTSCYIRWSKIINIDLYLAFRLWLASNNRSTSSPQILFCKSSKRSRKRKELTYPWFVWSMPENLLPTSRTLPIITWRPVTPFTCSSSSRVETETYHNVVIDWLNRFLCYFKS